MIALIISPWHYYPFMIGRHISFRILRQAGVCRFGQVIEQPGECLLDIQ
jgi:hypothetical protein